MSSNRTKARTCPNCSTGRLYLSHPAAVVCDHCLYEQPDATRAAPDGERAWAAPEPADAGSGGHRIDAGRDDMDRRRRP